MPKTIEALEYELLREFNMVAEAKVTKSAMNCTREIQLFNSPLIIKT
jgi:hypothetical protein